MPGIYYISGSASRLDINPLEVAHSSPALRPGSPAPITMTPEEFMPEYMKLAAAFGKKANALQAKAWANGIGNVSVDILSRTVNHIIDNDERFPSSISYLKAKIDFFLPDPPRLQSCRHCIEGRIYYEYERNAMSYETSAACDCKSGDTVSTRIIQKWVDRGIDVKVPQSSRYSWLWQKYGGIDTALGGFGIRVETMSSNETGSMKGMDRGLSRLAVTYYAKFKGMGYDQAHSYLSNNASKLYGLCPMGDDEKGESRTITVEQDLDKLLGI